MLALAQVIDEAMRPGNFFAAPEMRLAWVSARAETIPWELFRGRLVERSQTRILKTFLAWHVIEENESHPASEPIISVKLDVHEKHIHVTRGLLAYVWEGHDAGGGVIESREVVKWTRELVGTLRLGDFTDLDSVRDELICLIWQAVVGSSRLPLHSVEAPLPVFSFGQLHYLFHDGAGAEPMRASADLMAAAGSLALDRPERIKLLEFALRCPGPHPQSLSQGMNAERSRAGTWLAVFNNVSLSPYGDFVPNALALLGERLHADEQLAFISGLLLQLGRHLTAYDLVTFHHRGANYPDALLLDALLDFLRQVDCFGPRGLADSRLRRALRQACLLRRHYDGHLVPDSPTSPGENARVLPPSHPRVPDGQLAHGTQRRRKLFADEPLGALLPKAARAILAAGVAELDQMDDRVEMGLGLFIDRPLGYAKQIGEPDVTPMLAHEAFSPSIARRRWAELKSLCAELNVPVDAAKLDPLFENGPWPTGLPHAAVADCPRPVAALSDVRKVAGDFAILRTLPGGLERMLRWIGQGDILPKPRLCVPARDAQGRPVIALYDPELRRRVELAVDVSQGYVTRAGVELPRAGVRVMANDTAD